jgi:hypothetical protein
MLPLCPVSRQTHYDSQYIVKEGRIGYKDHDDVNFKAVVGFSTMFAHFLEQAKGTISEDVLKASIMMPVRCGGFNYAAIPSKYKYTLGVTGTLAALSDSEKAVLTDEFNVHRQTLVPSVYGDYKVKFEKGDLRYVHTSYVHQAPFILADW